MELNSEDGMLLVADAHDFPFVSFGGDLKERRQGVPFDHQGMIASGQEWVRHSSEEVPSVVFDRRGFAVHHPVIHDHIRTKSMSDALVPEAYPQQWQLGPESANDVIGKARLPWRAWSG